MRAQNQQDLIYKDRMERRAEAKPRKRPSQREERASQAKRGVCIRVVSAAPDAGAAPQLRDSVKRRMRNVDFEYEMRRSNFDRNKVKGLVASLVNLDKVNYKASTALEITACGRLYNVVVESDEVSLSSLSIGSRASEYRLQ